MSGQIPDTQSHTEPAVDPAKLVFWVDVLLLGVLGVAALVALPRRLGRIIGGYGEWRRGHILYQTRVTDFRLNATGSSNSTLLEHNPNATHHLRHMLPNGGASFASSRVVHKTLCLLRKPVSPGYSVGRTVLMLLYFGVLLFAALFRDSVFTNPVRDAWIAVSQLPFVFALAGKNNIFSVLLGVGYEKLNYLHRYAGRLFVLAANVHAIGFIYKWTLQGVWTQRLQQAEFRWGVVALVSADILFFFSLRLVRQLSYNFFYVSHLIALCVLIVAVSLHQSASRPYTIIAAGLYIADRLLRLLKSRVTIAHIQQLPELGSIRMRIPSINAGWRAGQHVRIRILSRHLGWIGWAEVHPFTIAGASGESGEGLTLLVKKTGNWSRRLYNLAGSEAGRNVRVHLNGPYGGPGNAILPSFSGAIFFVGGSGITYALAAAREILHQRATSRTTSGTGTVEVVWSVQHRRAIIPLLPTFTSLLQHQPGTTSLAAGDDDASTHPSTSSTASDSASHPTLKISIYYTRTDSDSEKGIHPLPDLPPGLTVHGFRPSVHHALDHFLDRVTDTLPNCMESDVEKCGVASGRGVAVGVCGPRSLAEDVRRAVEDVDESKRKCVGGLELVEETFQW